MYLLPSWPCLPVHQFQKKLRRKHPAVHRFNGRVYVFMILLFGAPSGLVIGYMRTEGSLHRSPLCCWPCCGGGSPGRLCESQKGLFRAHRIFMIRSFALTLSAITLRAWSVCDRGSVPSPSDGCLPDSGLAGMDTEPAHC